MPFERGQKFSSFAEVQRAVDIYSKNNNVHYWKRTAIKLEKSKRKITKSKPELVYYCLKYACVHGGRKYQRKKNCLSNRQKQTIKIGCQSHISFLLSEDGKFLKVTSSNLVHSHETNEELYKLYPKERRLPPDVQKTVSKMMKLRVNKRWLQAKVMKETGKTVLLKDLSNIAAKFKKPEKEVMEETGKTVLLKNLSSTKFQSPEAKVMQVTGKTVLLKDLLNIAAKFKGPKRDIDEVVNNMLAKHKCSSVEILEKDQILEGLFFQDERMKRIYFGFPETLFFDGTYELVNLKFRCYIFFVEDGNGNSEIVGVGLLAKDDKSSLEWLVECFKQNNDKWSETQLIMTDKDLVERGVFKEKFPHASLAISLYHALRTFEREITGKKMNASIHEIKEAQVILRKLSKARNEAIYQDIYEEFITFSPEAVADYFNKNWHPIREEWTSMCSQFGNFLNRTNNGLESFIEKLEFVDEPFSTMVDFIDNFFILLSSLRSERDEDMSNSIFEANCLEIHHSCEALFLDLVQPFAFEHISEELRRIEETCIFKVEEEYWYSEEGILQKVSTDHCSCNFRRSMLLPCRHIFCVRQKEDLDLYTPDLVHRRWTKAYNAQHHDNLCKDVPVRQIVKVHQKQQKTSIKNSESDVHETQPETTIENNESEVHQKQPKKIIKTNESRVHQKQLKPIIKNNKSKVHQKQLKTAIKNECKVPQTQPKIMIRNNRSKIHQKQRKTIKNNRSKAHQEQPKTKQQKYEELFPLANELAKLVSESGGKVYLERKLLLEKLLGLWKRNKRVIVPTKNKLPSVSRDTDDDLPTHRSNITSEEKPEIEKPKPKCSRINSPKSLVKRGCPKGFDKAAIATKRRKISIPNAIKQSLLTRQKTILSWFVGEEKAQKSISEGEIITEEEIDVIPTNISSSCADPSINVNIVRKFFTEDSWKLVEDIIKMKKFDRDKKVIAPQESSE